MYSKSNQSGRTMLEAIMYVSLLMVLGTVIAGHINNAFRRYKIGRTAQQVIDFKKAVIHFTAADEDYTRLSVADMDAQHSIPLDMRAAFGTARHALGGSVTTGPIGSEGNNKYMFYITFNNLFKGGCVEILTQGQFYGDGSDMDTLIVNGQTAWNYQYSFYDTTGISKVHTMLPASPDTPVVDIRLTITDAVAACTEKDNNSITWIFS